MPLHVEISPISCQVASSFLFRDETREDYEPGKIIAVSSYPGSTPTLKVLLENGALFSYVPVSALRSHRTSGEKTPVNKDTFTFTTCKEEIEPIYDSFSKFLAKKGPGFYAFGLSDLCYNNCPSESMTVTVFESLQHYPVVAYLKNCKLFIDAFYHFTVDWSNANILLHFLELQNGQFAFLPSHKILFNNNPTALKELPKYRAVHGMFTVENQENS